MMHKCCYIGAAGDDCGKPAEWRIVDGPRPDDYTESCCHHVGYLLSDNIQEIRVYPIEEEKVKYEDLKTSSFEIGLTRLLCRPIREVHGYLSNEPGEPVFKLTRVEFVDGTQLGYEGEHDFPYLVEYGKDTPPSYNNERLSQLYEEMRINHGPRDRGAA